MLQFSYPNCSFYFFKELNSLFLFLIITYSLSFGFVRSQYQHMGSSLPCTGFSLVMTCSAQSPRALRFWHVGSRASRLSSCGMKAQLPHSKRILVPGLGIYATFPALEGEFSTTGLPGKSLTQTFLYHLGVLVQITYVLLFFTIYTFTFQLVADFLNLVRQTSHHFHLIQTGHERYHLNYSMKY